MHLMHKLMVTVHRASANLHIHVPHYTHFIPFTSKNEFKNREMAFLTVCVPFRFQIHARANSYASFMTLEYRSIVFSSFHFKLFIYRKLITLTEKLKNV